PASRLDEENLVADLEVRGFRGPAIDADIVAVVAHQLPQDLGVKWHALLAEDGEPAATGGLGDRELQRPDRQFAADPFRFRKAARNRLHVDDNIGAEAPRIGNA